MKIYRPFAIFILLFVAFSSAFSQEICNNGKDDDGDKFVDLNDTADCKCTAISSTTNNVSSLIPNPSFEQYTICPTSYSQMSNAKSWTQATSVTSDYMNTCNFMPNSVPMPLPDGKGIVGTIFNKGWQEYVGTCLSSPMVVGTQYTLSFYLAGTTTDPYLNKCSSGGVALGPIDITLFGYTSCPTFPVITSGCPIGWQVLGTINYTPNGNWDLVTITFTPTVSIYAIILGSPCTLPSDYSAYYSKYNCYPYFFYDNLVLNETSLFNNSLAISQSGDCKDDTVLTATAGNSSGGSWQWYKEGIAMPNQKDSLINITQAGYGAGNYTIQLTIGTDCQYSTITVPSGITLNADFDGSTAICKNTSASFTDQSAISGSSISSWQWNFGDGGTATQQNSSHTYSTVGNYTVTLTISTFEGCTDTYSQSIQVSNGPTLSVSSTDENCGMKDGTATVSASGGSGSYTYEWSTSPKQTTAMASGLSAGTYSVTVDDGICPSVVASVNVIADPYALVPIADFSFNNVCLYDSASFTNQSTISSGIISIYQWDFGDGHSSNIPSPTHKFTQSGNYSISLTAVSGNNCSDTIFQTITVFAIPQAAIMTNNVCDQQSASFTDATNNNGTLITSWQWDFGNGTASTEQNPSIVFASDGTYHSSLIVTTSEGCSDTAEQIIEIYPLPIADYTTNTVCLNETSYFSNLSYLSSGSMNYQWNFGDGNTSITQSPTHTYLSEGAYQVTLKTISDKGCEDDITQLLTIYPLPVVNFSPDLYNGCMPLDVIFANYTTISSTNLQSFEWDFGDGNTSSSQSPNHSFTQSGIYPISLTVTSDKACTSINDTSVVIEAYPLPIADFNYTPEYITIMSPQVEFSDLSFDPTSWNWILGDGNITDEQHPTHTYSDTGTYQIELWISNQYGCIDSSSGQLRIEPEFMLYIPNAFTPNGDGINDVLNARGWGITELNMNILDRWGNIIFTVSDLNEGWDGKVNGKNVQQDVYLYQFHAIDVFDKKHNYTGKVSLIR
jgi:gliding motility-associated-like protein